MEVRRGARVTTTFLVAVEGLDERPVLRRGDISATGVYFDTDRDVGGVGTIQWLQLITADGERPMRVMAYVVRTVHLADAGGSLGGVAFEFMPESDDAQTAVHEFVRHTLLLRAGSEAPRVGQRLAVKVGSPANGKNGAPAPTPPAPSYKPPSSHMRARSGDADNATMRQLSVRSLVLETSWAIPPGESVRVDIVAPGMTRRIRLEGRAVRVAPRSSPGRYDIELEVDTETDRPLRLDSTTTMAAVNPDAHTPRAARDDDSFRALDDLLSALVLPPQLESSRSRCHQLSGEIARVRLATLFALFEMEQMTGRLVVRGDIEEIRVFVQKGRIVDIEPVGPGEEARKQLGALVAWEEGSFEFYVEPVIREDRIGMSTTGLLLEFARQADEANRG